MKTLFYTFMILSLAPAAVSLAQAEDTETFSRGLQQAKRVATLENQDDLPSRAYWLSRRCIKNSKKKLSFQNASELEGQSAPQQN